MSRADGLPFSSNGQRLALPVNGNSQHGLRSAGIQGDVNAIPPHQTLQPGTHGASDAEWNATLDENSQSRVGPRRRCLEGGDSTRPNVGGRDMVGIERGSLIREANGEAPHTQRRHTSYNEQGSGLNATDTSDVPDTDMRGHT